MRERFSSVVAIVFGGIGIAILAVALLFRIGAGTGLIDPHVKIYANEFDSNEQNERRLIQPQPLMPAALNREVLRTTERLRELMALTYALSLYATGERLQKNVAPATIEDLLEGAEENGLLPPGISIENSKGMLKVTHQNSSGERASHGQILVRYRPVPFALETLAVGLNRREGPALLLRLPDEEDERQIRTDKRIGYYQATRLDGVITPKAFADVSEVIAGGWTRVELNAEAIASDDQLELRNWAQKQNF